MTGVSPNNGPIWGGASVTSTVTGFTNATAVIFGGDAAGCTVNSDTSITATTPAIESADTADITVTTIGGISATSAADRFTFTTTVNYTNSTLAEIPHMWKSAAYENMTPQRLQKFGAQVVDFLLALSNPRPAPVTTLAGIPQGCSSKFPPGWWRALRVTSSCERVIAGAWARIRKLSPVMLMTTLRVQEPIEHRGADGGVVEDVAPRADPAVGGEDDRAALLALRDHLEER